MKNNLLDKPVLKNILNIGLPLIFSLFFEALYLLVDQYFIMGIDRNNLYLSGITQTVFPLIFLINALGLTFYVGLNAEFSRAIGSGNTQYQNRALPNTLIVAILFSIIIICVGLIFNRPLLIATGARDNIYPLARNYFSCLILGTPFILIISCLQGFFQAQGNTKIIMVTQIAGNIINAILTPMLIFGFLFIPSFGIVGAALATLIAHIFRIAIYWFYLHRTAENKLLFSQILPLDLKIPLSVVRAGLPMTISTLTITFSSFIVNNVISSIDEAGLGALGMVGRVAMFAILPSQAISSTIVTLVGQSYGARNLNYLTKTLRISLSIAFIFTAGMGIILFLVATPLIKLFSANEYIIDITKNYLQIDSLSYGFLAVEMISRQAFIGINRHRIAIAQVLIRFLGIYLGCIFLFVYIFDFGLTGIWLGTSLSNILSGIIGFLWLRHTIKKITYDEN